MDEAWRVETERVTGFFDQIASFYRQEYASELETAFRLRQALYVLDNDRDPSIVGTVDEHLGAL